MANRRRGGRARGGRGGGTPYQRNFNQFHSKTSPNKMVSNVVPTSSDDFIPITTTSPKFVATSSPIKPLRISTKSNNRSPSRSRDSSNKSSASKQAQTASSKSPKEKVNENNKRVLRSSSVGIGQPEPKKKRNSNSETVVSNVAGDVIDLAISDESNPPTQTSQTTKSPVAVIKSPVRTSTVRTNPNQRAQGDSNTKFYVVIDGHKPGIYKSVLEAWSNIDGYRKAFVKTFNNESDAKFFLETYINMQSSTITQSTVIKSPGNVNPKESGRKSGINSRFNLQPTTNFGPSCNGVFGASKGHVDIYTDGSYETKSNKGGIGVYWGPNDSRNVSEPLEGLATSNRAEVRAAIRGIRDAKAQGYSSVAIHTDSLNLINSIRQWVDDYMSKRKNKKKIEGVLERDLLDLVDAITGLAITWVKVKGHSGVEGNEAADKLAKAGREKYVKTTTNPIPVRVAKNNVKSRLGNAQNHYTRSKMATTSVPTIADYDSNLYNNYFAQDRPQNAYWQSVYNPQLFNQIAPPFPYQ